MSLRINIDSDSVVYDLTPELLRRANRKFGTNVATQTTWSLSDHFPMTTEEASQFFEAESKKGLYALGRQVDGAVSALTQLAEAGHDLRIVTHKHGMGAGKVHAMSDMIGWYERQGLLELVDIVFARGDKTQYPADVVIDDKPTCAWTQYDAFNILFDQPWNQTLTHATHATKVNLRAKGWADVLEVIYQLEKKGA